MSRGGTGGLLNISGHVDGGKVHLHSKSARCCGCAVPSNTATGSIWEYRSVGIAEMARSNVDVRHHRGDSYQGAPRACNMEIYYLATASPTSCTLRTWLDANADRSRFIFVIRVPSGELLERMQYGSVFFIFDI